MDLGALLEEEHMPHCIMAVAYGSGAVPQAGYENADKPMLDLILVVEDPENWHRENLASNASHYSALALGGAAFVAQVQRTTAGVYYNTLIPMRGSGNVGRLMKYGVVGRADLEKDLNEWTWLYLSGRLHKPVLMAPFDESETLSAALEGNLISALKASLLLLPEEFSREQLYMEVAGLSYGGDFRMLFGENPDKVINIVRPNLPRFEKLFSPALEDLSSFCNWGGAAGSARQDMSPSARYFLSSTLPISVRPGVDNFSAEALRAQLRAVVRKSSAVQSAKGAATAGPLKSAQYSGAKVAKWASWWARRLKG